jgi:hypothetical protein
MHPNAECSKIYKTATMKNTSISFGKALLILGLPAALLLCSCAANEDKAEAPDSVSSLKQKAGSNQYSEGGTYGNATASYNETETQADSTKTVLGEEDNVYKPMATGKLNDTNHVFMRNADMRCSVNDVRRATFEIERIVRKYDGFVTYTSLSGNKTLYYSNRVAKDSVLETYHLNVYNDITLRVPNESLDSLLIELNGLIEFIDNRTIKADDVKLQLLAMSLRSKRNKQHINNLSGAVNSQGKKLPQTIDGLDRIDQTRASLDEEQINLLDMKDKVSFSTVKLYVYQPEVTQYKKVAYQAPVDPYTPSFSDRLTSTGTSSMVILQYLVLFFVVLWPFLLVFLLVWFLIRWMIRAKVAARIFKV